MAVSGRKGNADRRTAVSIAASAWADMAGEAAARRPAECCGALVGSATGGVRRVVRAEPVRNTAADAASGYLIPAARVLELERGAEAAGLEVVGFYHSHPAGRGEFSPADAAAAWPWYAYLVIPIARGSAGRPRAWVMAIGGELAEADVEIEGA
jgi:proteasome lid subunit RPN8/RPN11